MEMPGCLRHMTRSGWWRDILLFVGTVCLCLVIREERCSMEGNIEVSVERGRVKKRR